MGAPVIHFHIAGKDGKQLREFYASLLDWKFNINNPMQYGHVDPTDGGIQGGVTTSHDGASGVCFFAKVDDLPAYLKKAETLGGKIVQAPIEVPGFGCEFALFTDPAGNIIGLMNGVPKPPNP